MMANGIMAYGARPTPGCSSASTSSSCLSAVNCIPWGAGLRREPAEWGGAGRRAGTGGPGARALLREAGSAQDPGAGRGRSSAVVGTAVGQQLLPAGG